MNGTRRYRHKAGVSCGVTNRSVPCEEVEADVARLLGLLEVAPEALKEMTALAVQIGLVHKPELGDVDPEQEKNEAIALCRRRIDAAVNLYKEGRIDYEEYRHAVDKNEREIAHWEARTPEVEQIGLELALCLDAIHHMSEMWERAEPEDKQGMIRNLFEYLAYDLDTRRITDFRLKPWADRFLILRAHMYDVEQGAASEELDDSGPEKENPYAAQGVHTEMPHRGLDTSILEQLRYAARRMVRETYVGLLLATAPVSRHTPPQHKRNTEIRARHGAGEPLSTLAEVFGISEQRVYQIVHGRRK